MVNGELAPKVRFRPLDLLFCHIQYGFMYFFLDIARDRLIQDYSAFAFEFPNHVEAAVCLSGDSADICYQLLIRIDSKTLTVERAQAYNQFENPHLIDLTGKWREIPVIQQKVEEIENAISH